MNEKRPGIFFVDDDEDDRAIIQETFHCTYPELHVALFHSGSELVAYLESLPEELYPSLLVLDYNMPVQRGDELLLTLKRDARFKSIPVIILSTTCSEKMEKEVISMGALACLQKQPKYTKFLEQMRLLESIALDHVRTGSIDPVLYQFERHHI